jgi:hypothetical protein
LDLLGVLFGESWEELIGRGEVWMQDTDGGGRSQGRSIRLGGGAGAKAEAFLGWRQIELGLQHF